VLDLKRTANVLAGLVVRNTIPVHARSEVLERVGLITAKRRFSVTGCICAADTLGTTT
jgi:hypothetical protein